MDRDEKIAWVVTGVFFGAAFLGGIVGLRDASKERGARKQFEMDKIRAEMKGFEL